MQLATFAKKGSKDVVDPNFERIVQIDGIKFTVTLTTGCWFRGNSLSVSVDSKLGEHRFKSPLLFSKARLVDLEKLIRRIKKTAPCRAPKCPGKFLEDDFVREKNARQLCERHRLLAEEKERKLIFAARERGFKLLDPKKHNAILKHGVLQDDESVQDAIYIYAERIVGAIKGNEDLHRLLADIDRDRGNKMNARAILGAAEYLLESGGRFDSRARTFVLKRLKVELEPKVLEDWKSPSRRKKELTAFQKKLSATA